MERFFFDVNDGSTPSRDTEGQLLASKAEAREMAVRELVLIIRDALPDGDRAGLVVTVRDAEGHPIYFVSASILGEKLVDF